MLTVWEQISENASLVSLPDIYLQLKEVLAEPDYTAAKVARIISYDPAISLRLLRIVNSAYFGLATEIKSVERAVSLLGISGIYDLVLAMSVAQSFKGISNEVMDMERFWQKSVICGITCRELAALCNVVDSEHPFLCGLLCDIGHLFIYQLFPDEAEQAIRIAQEQDIPLHKAERNLVGTDYADVGAALMRRWQLPQNLWEPTEYHIEPERSQEYQFFSCLVHIAVLMTEAGDHHEAIDKTLGKVSPLAWQITGLSAEHCVAIIPKVDMQISDVMQMVFPSRKSA